MGKFKVFVFLVCLLLIEINAIKTGSEDLLSGKSRRFLIDWITSSAAYLAGGTAALVKSECVLCKCYNRCNGEQLGEQLLGIKANETTVCGKQLWASINCTDKHNQITSAPAHGETFKECDKLCSIYAVAKSQSVSNPNASICLSGVRGSNEALPMNCCGLKATNTWTKGVAVMTNCQTVPHYTPVAAFINDAYVPGTAGIFSACLSNGEIGFQMIRQDCDQKPDLLHISKSKTSHYNPDIFFVIN